MDLDCQPNTVRFGRARRRLGRGATILMAWLLAHFLAAPPAAAQQRVGIDSAVNPQASGTPLGAASRGLAIGQEVLFNERLATASAGQVQVLFLDESALSRPELGCRGRPVRVRP